MLGMPLCVRNATDITQGLVLLNVQYVTRWAITQGFARTKDRLLGVIHHQQHSFVILAEKKDTMQLDVLLALEVLIFNGIKERSQ